MGSLELGVANCQDDDKGLINWHSLKTSNINDT